MNTQEEVEQAREAYLSAHSGSKARQTAMEKWEQLSMRQAEAATTIEQARAAYISAPGGSKAEQAAREKMKTMETEKRKAEATKHSVSFCHLCNCMTRNVCEKCKKVKR